ncbi:ABC transporter permease [Paenibacillus sp. NPDC057967]|uniref:ABC transporter permease n=1 Tax=Paenibacillus sp. NPDC057967 TaxID=3346293 RepID=UPI0036DD23FD
MRHWLRMYQKFIKVYMKQQLEYRFSFFGDLFVNMLTFVTLYLGFWIIFNKFDLLNGWTYYDVMFLYNINLVSYAISSFFLWNPMKQLENLVRNGDFDNYLTRPLSPLRLLIMRQVGHTFIAHIAVSIVIFAICFVKLDINWTFTNIVFFISIILGATCIHAAIIIAAASSAFWVVRSGTIVDISIYAIRDYINYPISIYARWLQILLTFIIPYGFVNYYPSTVLLNKEVHSSLNIIQYGTPVVGIVLLFGACLLFYSGIRQYESTGS